MKDSGQLIAIVIGIIILIVNVVRKKKQNTIMPKSNLPKNTQPNQPNTGIPSLDEILREFSGETMIPKTETLEEIKNESASLETIDANPSYESYSPKDYQFSQLYEFKPETTPVDSNAVIHIEDFAHPKEEMLISGLNFNIRDAILFSEVLKRPNY